MEIFCRNRKASKGGKFHKNNRPVRKYSPCKISDNVALSAPSHTNCPCDGGCPRCITKARYVSKYGAITKCDVIIHPDDFIMYQLGKKVRTKGDGIPKITIFDKSLKTKYPCLYEAVMAHENQHVKNSGVNCKNFKKCVDEKSSTFFGLGEPKISADDFDECMKTHHGGATSDCVTDEKSAYETGLKKIKELSADPKCVAEKTVIQDAIKQWTKYKAKPPNC